MSVQPTAKEAEFLYAVICNMKAKPDVNWEGVANNLGLKNANTASVRYGQIKKKLGFGSTATSSTGTTPTKTARARGKSVGSGTKTTPKKITKTTGGRKKATKVKEEQNEVYDEEEAAEADDEGLGGPVKGEQEDGEDFGGQFKGELEEFEEFEKQQSSLAHQEYFESEEAFKDDLVAQLAATHAQSQRNWEDQV